MVRILNGTWKVVPITGKIWFLLMIGNKKIIYNGVGHNVFMGKKWGKFKIINNMSKDKFYLVYNSDKIIDKITVVDSGKMWGEFRLKERRVGNFVMIKLKD